MLTINLKRRIATTILMAIFTYVTRLIIDTVYPVEPK